MTHVLIGGEGFVGTHLQHCFALRKIPWVSVDIRQPSSPHTSFVYADITKPLTLSLHDVDTVYHLAALRNPRKADEHKAMTFAVNVEGTWNVAEWARRCDARRIVFMSTYAVYGNNAMPSSESTPPLPCNTYGFTKYLGELILQEVCRTYGISLLVLRSAPLYGEGLYEGLGADLVKRALQHKRLVFKEQGKQRRPYLHIEDLLDAIDLLLSQHASGIYNVAGDHLISLREIAYLVAEKIGNVSVEFGTCDETFPGDIIDGALDCTKLKACGWSPRRTFEAWYPRYLDSLIECECGLQ